MDKPFYKQQYLASRIRQYKRKRNIGFFPEDYLRARPFGNIIVAFGSRWQFKGINFFSFTGSEPNSKHATEFCLNIIKVPRAWAARSNSKHCATHQSSRRMIKTLNWVGLVSTRHRSNYAFNGSNAIRVARRQTLKYENTHRLRRF